MRFATLTVLLLLCFGIRAQQPPPGWSAHWIAAPAASPRDGAEADGSRPMPLFRRAFHTSGPVRRAELRIAGLGQFKASIGIVGRLQLVTPPGLHQAWTDYRKTVTYATYDVTALLQTRGAHVLAVELGNGMYNVQRTVLPTGKARYTKFENSFGPPKMIAELRLTYRDGRSETIATGRAWKTAPGPTLFSSTFGGEDFDARREPAGWNSPAFSDRGWENVSEVEGPGGTLVAALAPEVGQAGLHRPIATHVLGDGRTVYDLGQNFAGIVHVQVRGPAGATLRLVPGELLNPDGSVSQRSSGGPMWWSYTLAGMHQPEDWEPRFGYYGFRYLQAEWTTAPGTLLSVLGIETHSTSPVAGSFHSGNDLLNRIDALIVSAIHNNEVSLFTDCPHREKLGWLEQTHLVADAMLFNNDLRGLYRATDLNIADAQDAAGMVPTIAPQYTHFGPRYPIYDDSPEWGSASILAPWAAYRFYGDPSELARAYPVMQRYLSYLQSRSRDGIVAYGLGDWYDLGPGDPGFSKLTTLGVTATLMLYEDAATLAKIAGILGHAADADRYRQLARQEADAFNQRFWNEAAGWYDTGSQTASAMPLALGIVPADRRARVLAHLVGDIHAHADHVTTGEVGFPYLLRALMQSGRNDVVFALATQTTAPSYGGQLAAGATALTEAWDTNPKNSQDHMMLGSGEEWFYRGLAGIDYDMSRAKPAERITLRPALLEAAGSAEATFHSELGVIESHWRATGDGFLYEITVPPAATATVILPSGAQDTASGPQLTAGGQTTFTAGPGPHRYSIPKGVGR